MSARIAAIRTSTSVSVRPVFIAAFHSCPLSESRSDWGVPLIEGFVETPGQALESGSLSSMAFFARFNAIDQFVISASPQCIASGPARAIIAPPQISPKYGLGRRVFRKVTGVATRKSCATI